MQRRIWLCASACYTHGDVVRWVVKQPTAEHFRDASGLDIFDSSSRWNCRLRAGPGRGGLITRFAVGSDEVFYSIGAPF